MGRMAEERPRIGISACLLGAPVRYDGGHKRDGFLVETVGRYVEWVPVCPEEEAGFGTPREPMRLQATGPRRSGGRAAGDPAALVVIRTGEDVTARLRGLAERRSGQLARAGLSGYILKKDSPSCGMERVRVHFPSGPPERTGRGLFADALMRQMPDLPVEEEGRLADPKLRENFIERVFAYQRLRRLFEGRWRHGDLVRFHTAHKLTLMAHAPSAYRALGRLVAEGRALPRRELETRYQSGFMEALRVVATPARHANVLQHMLGYFNKTLDADARSELVALIDEHRCGLVPLIVPITLMRHHLRRVRVPYLDGQVYLDPHPRELALRNHV
jgi:uncharacterized protein YbgA (DUF1722 family)/uncharacterized protein YbbK (DUF523 family)